MTVLKLVGSVLLLGALAAYVFYDDSAPSQRAAKIFELPRQSPTAWQLRTPALQQRFAQDQLYIADKPRPLDQRAMSNWWRYLGNLRGDQQQTISNLADLASFNIDGSHTFQFGDQAISWGSKGAYTYVFDRSSSVLHVLPKRVFAEIQERTGRLDQRALLPSGDLNSVRINDLHLIPDEQRGWIDSLRLQRPAFTLRVRALLGLIQGWELSSLQGYTVPPHATPLAHLDIGFLNGQQLSLSTAYLGDQLYVSGPDLPTQRYAGLQARRLRAAVAEFSKDYVSNMFVSVSPQPIGRIDIYEGSIQRFVISRSSLYDETLEGRSNWTIQVLRPDGEVSAVYPGAIKTGTRFYEALLAMELSASMPHASTQPWSAPAEGHWGFRFSGSTLGQGHWLHVGPSGAAGLGMVQSQELSGTLKSADALFTNFKLEQILDDSLLRVRSARISKVQRSWHQDSFRAELLSRTDGRWTQVEKQATADQRIMDGPQQAFDAAPIQALLDRLAHAQADAVALAGEADRQAALTAARRLAVHVDAVAADDAEGERLLDDTMSRDWGLALWRDGEQWRAFEQQNGQLVYTLQDDLVTALFAPLEQGQAFAIVPQQVIGVHVVLPDGTDYRLNRQGPASWVVRYQDVDYPGVSKQVYRFLRQLSQLRIGETDALQAPVDRSGPTIAKITCYMPGLDDDDYTHWELRIDLQASGTSWASTRRDPEGSVIMPNRFTIPMPVAQQYVLAPSVFIEEGALQP